MSAGGEGGKRKTREQSFPCGWSGLLSRLDQLTWHRAIFAGSYPPTIFAAATFHT